MAETYFPFTRFFATWEFFFLNKLYESLGFQTSTVHCDCCGCSTCEENIEIKGFVLTHTQKKCLYCMSDFMDTVWTEKGIKIRW